MFSKIVLLGFSGMLFFSGCSHVENVQPPKPKKHVVQKKKNEIFDMFNNKFHFKNKRSYSKKPIYEIIYQNYNQRNKNGK